MPKSKKKQKKCLRKGRKRTTKDFKLKPTISQLIENESPSFFDDCLFTFQAKMSNICRFQLLKREDVLLLFVTSDNK